MQDINPIFSRAKSVKIGRVFTGICKYPSVFYKEVHYVQDPKATQVTGLKTFMGLCGEDNV